MAKLVVTPQVLRETKQAIESALAEATAVANQYRDDHENIATAAWGGRAMGASVSTAGQVHAELLKMMDGANRLANGLEQAAHLMENHEDNAAHALVSFAPSSSVNV